MAFAALAILVAAVGITPHFVAAGPASVHHDAECSLQLYGHGNNKLEIATAALDCTSATGGPLTVGYNSSHLKEHVRGFSGVKLVPYTELSCCNTKSLAEIRSLLYFCGNYSVALREPVIKDIWLPPARQGILNGLCVFGGCQCDEWCNHT